MPASLVEGEVRDEGRPLPLLWRVQSVVIGYLSAIPGLVYQLIDKDLFSQTLVFQRLKWELPSQTHKFEGVRRLVISSASY